LMLVAEMKFRLVLLLLVLGVAVLAGVSSAKSGNGGVKVDRYGGVREVDYGADFEDDSMFATEQTEGPLRDAVSTHDLLERHGLSLIALKFEKFIGIFDDGTDFFKKLNSDDKFDILNDVIRSFKRSFLMVINEFSSAKPAPSGSLSLAQASDFLVRQEVHFKSMLVANPKIVKDEWNHFLGMTHMIFNSLKKLYSLALESHLAPEWWMLEMASPMINNIPDDLFDRETFKDLLDVPTGIRNTIHDVLESALTSDYGPILKIGAQLAANYDWRKLMNTGHKDL